MVEKSFLQISQYFILDFATKKSGITGLLNELCTCQLRRTLG